MQKKRLAVAFASVLAVPTFALAQSGLTIRGVFKISAENVRRAARAALIAADRNEFKVIAIPGIGCDLGDVPIEESVRAIVEELRAHKRPHPETVYLVDPQPAVVLAFEEALRNAQQNL